MTVIVNGAKPGIFKEYEPVVYEKEGLAGFEGSYYSKELDLNYSLKLEGDLLILYINGSKQSPLECIMENLFSNDDYGMFQFKNNKEDKISSFRLSAGRVKNLNFEKK